MPPQALLLAAAQAAQGVGQGCLQQLDLVLLQLQLLLQVGDPVLHVHVAASRHRVIWTRGTEGSWVRSEPMGHDGKVQHGVVEAHDISVFIHNNSGNLLGFWFLFRCDGLAVPIENITEHFAGIKKIEPRLTASWILVAHFSDHKHKLLLWGSLTDPCCCSVNNGLEVLSWH